MVAVASRGIGRTSPVHSSSASRAIAKEMCGTSKGRGKTPPSLPPNLAFPAKRWMRRRGALSPTGVLVPTTSTSLIELDMGSDWTVTSGPTWCEETKRRFDRACVSATSLASICTVSSVCVSRTACTSPRMGQSSSRPRAHPSKSPTESLREPRRGAAARWSSIHSEAVPCPFPNLRRTKRGEA